MPKSIIKTFFHRSKYEYFVKTGLRTSAIEKLLLTNRVLNVIIICKSFANLSEI